MTEGCLPETDAKDSASLPNPCGCITCGDEAVALRVLDVGATGLAVCENEAGERTEIEVGLLDPVARGDEILAHAGTAIARAPMDVRPEAERFDQYAGLDAPAEVTL